MLGTRNVVPSVLCPRPGCDGEWEFEAQVCPADPPAGYPTAYVEWDLETGKKITEHTCDAVRLEWPELEAALGAVEAELLPGRAPCRPA